MDRKHNCVFFFIRHTDILLYLTYIYMCIEFVTCVY